MSSFSPGQTLQELIAAARVAGVTIESFNSTVIFRPRTGLPIRVKLSEANVESIRKELEYAGVELPSVSGPAQDLAAPIVRMLPVKYMRPHSVVQEYRHHYTHPRQRESQIQYLVSKWDMRKCEPLQVLRADPTYIEVVRGGHRLAAAERLGIRELPCIDLPSGLNLDELVEIAMGQEKTRNWTTFGNFKLRADVGLEPEASIQATLRKYGAELSPTASGGYSCTQKLARAYEMDVLEATISILQSAWPNAGGRHQVVVQAVSKFDHHYSQEAPDLYDRHNFAGRLRNRDAQELRVNAQSRARALGVSPVSLLIDDLLSIYNARRPVRTQLPPWRGKKS